MKCLNVNFLVSYFHQIFARVSDNKLFLFSSVLPIEQLPTKKLTILSFILYLFDAISIYCMIRYSIIIKY